MTQPDPPSNEDLRTPLSFKLMVVLAVVYLGWRLIQGVVWVFQHLF
ncbi:MAG: hypothetical protein WBM90_00775 [Acidimicrobiia bacterium]